MWLDSKLFVRERFSDAIRRASISLRLKRTSSTLASQCPTMRPINPQATFPGLVRAADLIGQLADINYLRKQPALFNEFRETGASEKLGYKSVADLRDSYPDFFWQTLRPYIGEALRHLRLTQEGKQWVARSLCQRLLDGASSATGQGTKSLRDRDAVAFVSGAAHPLTWALRALQPVRSANVPAPAALVLGPL